MCLALHRTNISISCHKTRRHMAWARRWSFASRAAYAAGPDRWRMFTGSLGGVATCEWWLWLTRVNSCTTSSLPSSTRDTIFRSLRFTACMERHTELLRTCDRLCTRPDPASRRTEGGVSAACSLASSAQYTYGSNTCCESSPDCSCSPLGARLVQSEHAAGRTCAAGRGRCESRRWCVSGSPAAAAMHSTAQTQARCCCIGGTTRSASPIWAPCRLSAPD
jgi:hypothetical protein